MTRLSPEIVWLLLSGSMVLLSLFGLAILFFLRRLIAHLDELTKSVQLFGEGLLKFDKQINEKVVEVRHEVATVRTANEGHKAELKRLADTVVLHDRRIQHIEDTGCAAKRSLCKS